ncbi:7TM diverse intracellular signaling domain-containing protein [Mucilaginibacter sp. CSA2-8R]|uniref:7TM diverse intracellular signaling domain-containing protein n=1 Tax=Mucilaginibacter sp. CSA2-8R TaxID=3141542 RepID=UPI00315C9487
MAQKAVQIDEHTNQHIFTGTEVEFLKDSANRFTIDDIQRADKEHRFTKNDDYYPESRPGIPYWYKVKLQVQDSRTGVPAVIEFFDQTTNDIVAFMPTAKGTYIQSRSGADLDFTNRLYDHKNFEFQLQHLPEGSYTCYFRVKPKDKVNIIMVYRTVSFFIHYALTEYLTYGLFYGIILIFSLHNLLMFLAVKKRRYIYYVLYILSVGLFEMSTDGIAFQYIWPNAPGWNQYAYGFALFSLSFFALAFTKELLDVRENAPRLNKIINIVIVLRSFYFVYCLLFNKSLFYYKFIEFIPLAIAFITGISIWIKGFKPARFFVVGYAFLCLGFIIKALAALGYTRMLPGAIGNYSLGMGFVLEMLFLSFSIGDQVRLLRRQKEEAQDATIKQMEVIHDLKDSINKELEIKVAERTREVNEKSNEILKQSHIIEMQNIELVTINQQLQDQASEITRMNVLLENDNIQLKTNIEKVTDARALSTELTFEEFSAKYPDQETCNKFLAGIKWVGDFACIKCGHHLYKNGRAPYSRRCSKCNYEESVLYNTIFQNNRIPINKAFYIVYLIYTTKGKISSYQLSEKLNIRQSTCWQYSLRIKEVLESQKRNKKSLQQGWSKLILNTEPLTVKI